MNDHPTPITYDYLTNAFIAHGDVERFSESETRGLLDERVRICLFVQQLIARMREYGEPVSHIRSLLDAIVSGQETLGDVL